MPTQEISRDVPATAVATVVEEFKASGATVEVTAKGDTFTVTATFSDDVVPTKLITPLRAHAGATAQIPIPSKSTSLAELSVEYKMCIDLCAMRPEKKGEVDAVVQTLLTLKPKYVSLATDLKIPWYFIAIVHRMESDNNFDTHLYNGDPLTARTVNVPKGRPLDGNPPYSWEESAKDALTLNGLAGLSVWDEVTTLYRLERYNGMGYRAFGIWTPYLWSYSNLYSKGRFVSDGKFEADSISEGCGAALLLRQMISN